MVKYFRKSSKLKPRRDGSEDDLFRKKKFKKLGPELDSDTEDQARKEDLSQEEGPSREESSGPR